MNVQKLFSSTFFIATYPKRERIRNTPITNHPKKPAPPATCNMLLRDLKILWVRAGMQKSKSLNLCIVVF
jgi:hypothetical protein